MSRTKRPINIRDVARAAGVSTMTVSRVINNPAVVAPPTRERVQQVIDELKYTPSSVARSLRSNRTYTIGLITVDFADHFFANLSVGAELEARRRGFRVMLSSTERNPNNEREFVTLLAEQRVDGILLARDAIQVPQDPLTDPLPVDVPIVSTGFFRPELALCSVDIDNVDGGRLATDHLLDHGHRRIAILTGPVDHKAAVDRLEGYQLALSRAGIKLDPHLIVHAHGRQPDDGYMAMNELIQREINFSAVFVYSDALAIGAMRALRRAGLKIPDDVSIVAYDNIDFAAFTDPPLTTIQQPIQELGALATRILIEYIETGERPVPITILRCFLVERGSVKTRSPE